MVYGCLLLPRAAVLHVDVTQKSSGGGERCRINKEFLGVLLDFEEWAAVRELLSSTRFVSSILHYLLSSSKLLGTLLLLTSDFINYSLITLESFTSLDS